MTKNQYIKKLEDENWKFYKYDKNLTVYINKIGKNTYYCAFDNKLAEFYYVENNRIHIFDHESLLDVEDFIYYNYED